MASPFAHGTGHELSRWSYDLTIFRFLVRAESLPYTKFPFTGQTDERRRRRPPPVSAENQDTGKLDAPW